MLAHVQRVSSSKTSSHTDIAKYHGRNAQELPKSSEQVVEIFDTTGDNCEGKKQSTFLSLNKCSVDSPPLDAIGTENPNVQRDWGGNPWSGFLQRGDVKGFQKPHEKVS